jgi:hypothetical protein
MCEVVNSPSWSSSWLRRQSGTMFNFFIIQSYLRVMAISPVCAGLCESTEVRYFIVAAPWM